MRIAHISRKNNFFKNVSYQFEKAFEGQNSYFIHTRDTNVHPVLWASYVSFRRRQLHLGAPIGIIITIIKSGIQICEHFDSNDNIMIPTYDINTSLSHTKLNT